VNVFLDGVDYDAKVVELDPRKKKVMLKKAKGDK
jgi:hypothetical protein